ncbi:hypothetical protein ACOMHN_022385 [Nucella lapillus]
MGKGGGGSKGRSEDAFSLFLMGSVLGRGGGGRGSSEHSFPPTWIFPSAVSQTGGGGNGSSGEVVWMQRGRKKLRSIQVVPSRNLHPLMVPPFLQPHPDLQSAVGNAPLSSKHPTHLPTTDCLLSITPLMGGQPSDAPALSPPSPLQQGGQSSNAPALSPPSPLPQGSQPIALALSPSSPLPQDGQPSDAPGLSPSSSTLLLCPSDSTLSICHLNSQSAVKTGDGGNRVRKVHIGPHWLHAAPKRRGVSVTR